MKNTLLSTIFLCCVLAVQAQQPIYVSPHGNDRAAGTLHHPLRTLHAAIQRIEQQSLKQDVQILLRQGEYELNRTVEIGDLPCSHLTIAPYADEKVLLSGGRKLPARVLKKVRDAADKARIQPQSLKYIREIDFKDLSIPLEGLRPSGFGRPSGTAWSELFVDGKPLQIARWPNDYTVLIGKILNPGANSKRPQTETPVFCYHEDRPSTWKDVRNLWIRGYFAHGYADDMIRVDHIDSQQKAIHTAQQTVYGFLTGAPFRVWSALNLLEELDRPGEYVIDPDKQKIYVYLDQPAEDLHISLLKEPLFALEHCRNVTLQHLTLAYGRHMGIYLEDTHHVRIQGCTLRNLGSVAISVGKGSTTPDKKALYPHAAESGGVATSRQIGDLQGKVYKDVTFNRQAGTDNGIEDCYIYDVGAGGISLGGGDRRTLTPANNYVQNCKIHDYNRIEKSYRPAVWMDGVGCRISKCDIYNAPSMAILFHGNNHLIEYCRITNVCGEVDDQGAIYYGRDAAEFGHVIRYNYFHKLSPRHRVTATYHDDGACGSEVYGNIYHNAGSLPVLIGGGHHHHYHHNLFIDSPTAIHLDNRMQNWGKGMVAKDGIIDQRLQVVNYTQPPYSEAYPALVHYWDGDPSYPHDNLIEGNLFYRIKNVVHGETQWAEFRNNWITNQDPGFNCPDDPLKGFKPDAAIFQQIQGFPQLPFDQIGCTLP